MKSTIFQIKISIESLVSRVGQVKNTISRKEGKVEKLDQLVKEN
jgi:hypothetical protein